MKGYDDCDADNGHVNGETKPGEESALVGTVVAGVGGVVGKEEGCQEGWAEERVRGGGAVSGGKVSGFVHRGVWFSSSSKYEMRGRIWDLRVYVYRVLAEYVVEEEGSHCAMKDTLTRNWEFSFVKRGSLRTSWRTCSQLKASGVPAARDMVGQLDSFTFRPGSSRDCGV